MITQHTKHNNEYNLIEYIEKDNGEIIKLERYDTKGKLIYQKDKEKVVTFTEFSSTGKTIKKIESNDGTWEHLEYDKANRLTYVLNSYKAWQVNCYYPPIQMPNGMTHNWLQHTELSNGQHTFYDFYGRIIRIKTHDDDWYYEYDDTNKTCKTINKGDKGGYSIIVQYLSVPNYLKIYYKEHQFIDDHVHICVHDPNHPWQISPTPSE